MGYLPQMNTTKKTPKTPKKKKRNEEMEVGSETYILDIPSVSLMWQRAAHPFSLMFDVRPILYMLTCAQYTYHLDIRKAAEDLDTREAAAAAAAAGGAAED